MSALFPKAGTYFLLTMISLGRKNLDRLVGFVTQKFHPKLKPILNIPMDKEFCFCPGAEWIRLTAWFQLLARKGHNNLVSSLDNIIPSLTLESHQKGPYVVANLIWWSWSSLASDDRRTIFQLIQKWLYEAGLPITLTSSKDFCRRPH